MKRNSSPKLIDYIFWIIFIFFTNPGGIIMAMGEDRGDGGINVVDFLYGGLAACYVIVSVRPTFKYDETFKRLIKYLILFILYDFLFYSYLVPTFKNPQFSLMYTLVKSRETVYSFTLFLFVYKFFRRSHIVFLHLLILSSTVVISLFLVTIVTGIEILPIYQFDRHYVSINRLVLTSYGLMPILIPMGVILITFKIEMKNKNFYIMAFGLMFMTWLLSLFRRYLFGSFIFLFIGLMYNNYFQGKSLLPIGRVFSIAIYSVILGFILFLSFPKYVEAGVITIEETINVIQNGEDSTGRKDERLGFSRDFIVGLIVDNPFFGTGFDNRWRTHEGDEQGYETSDYPLLAALAMKGLIGVLIFLPVYLILVRTIVKDVRFIKMNNLDFNRKEFFLFMFFILYFTYDLLLYMNWFTPVAMSRDYEWLTLLAMYLASRENYFIKLKQHSFEKSSNNNRGL